VEEPGPQRSLPGAGGQLLYPRVRVGAASRAGPVSRAGEYGGQLSRPAAHSWHLSPPACAARQQLTCSSRPRPPPALLQLPHRPQVAPQPAPPPGRRVSCGARPAARPALQLRPAARPPGSGAGRGLPGRPVETCTPGRRPVPGGHGSAPHQDEWSSGSHTRPTSGRHCTWVLSMRCGLPGAGQPGEGPEHVWRPHLSAPPPGHSPPLGPPNTGHSLFALFRTMNPTFQSCLINQLSMSLCVRVSANVFSIIDRRWP
jgi:hypothetical protein